MGLHFTSFSPIPSTTDGQRQPAPMQGGTVQSAPVRFAESTEGDRLDSTRTADEGTQQRKSTGQDLPKPSLKDRFKYAARLAVRHGFNRQGLISDTKWALGICIATCWLPGTQLLTIPINYGIFITVRMLHGAWTGWSKAAELKRLEAQGQ